jgi:hypothetical protein
MNNDDTASTQRERPPADPAAEGASATVVLPDRAAAEPYLAGVRAALADLPADEVAEILGDVGAHLVDLSAELRPGVDLAAFTARLGTPEAYAAELRAAAGYAAAPEVTGKHGPGSAVARLALLSLIASVLVMVFDVSAKLVIGWRSGLRPEELLLFEGVLLVLALPLLGRDGPGVPTVAALPEVRRFRALRPAAGSSVRAVADFVVGLQPAWWVVRACVAAVLLVAVLDPSASAGVVLLAVAGVPVSIWLGLRARSDRRLLWIVVPLNCLAGLVLLPVLLDGPDVVRGLDHERAAEVVSQFAAGLRQGSDQILDIRPVDAAGNPLTGIYLFDQYGQPIDATGSDSCAGVPPSGVDHDPYPRGTTRYDSSGRCVTVPPGPLVVVVPSPTAAASPTAAVPPSEAPIPPVGSTAPVPAQPVG